MTADAQSEATLLEVAARVIALSALVFSIPVGEEVSAGRIDLFKALGGVW